MIGIWIRILYRKLPVRCILYKKRFRKIENESEPDVMNDQSLSSEPERIGYRIMKAVISVIGNDRVGILAMTSTLCASRSVNILEVAQTILDGTFSMTMIVDMNAMIVPFDVFASEMEELGLQQALIIRVMNQEIFNAMHSI